MKVLSIGYGRNLFNQEDFEHQRLSRCAREVESLDHIVFTNKSDGFKKISTENGFSLHPTSSLHKLTMIFDAIKIGNKIIKTNKIDTISTQDLFEAGLVGLVLKILHPELTLQVQEHADVLASIHWRREKLINRFWYWFAFGVLKKADIVRVVSDRTKDFLHVHLGPEKNIRKLPVVIDTAAFAVQNDHSENANKDTFIFITVARFVPQKNFPLMLNAFAQAYKQCPRIRLKIFGSGTLEEAIKEQIKSLGLAEAVEIKGWTDDVAGEMLRSNAYLLTSNYEGWARVLIEALLQKLPVVTTDVGCVHEVVKDQQHGLVVPVDDLPKLTEAILEIVNNKVLYQNIKANLNSVSLSNIPGTVLDEYAGLWVKTLR